jgi:putative alpha-1,2-mannosidase
MELRKWLLLLGLLLGGFSLFGQKTTSFVNVFIGTEGTGHTFPGPSMPFGMVQPGPDNRDRGWSHTSGYQYRDTLLLGFSQTRLSGTGINELGDILILPIHRCLIIIN